MKRLIYTFALLFVSFGAMAAGYTSGTKIYFDPGCWNVDGAKFVVYMWNSSSNGWASIDIDEEDSSIFSFECPGTGKTWTQAIFLRKSNSNLDWSGEYNRIGDISLPGSFSNQISITGWNANNYKWSTYSQPTWTIVGNSINLFGTEWDPTKTENDLTKGQNAVWKKTYSGVTLKKGNIEYKVCKNHDWTIVYPGSNAILNISSDGKYNVTFSFNSSKNEVSASAELIPEPTVPQIKSFTASPSEIDLEQSVTFDVEVENADKNDVVFKIGDETISNPWTPTEGGVYNITANLDGATSKSVNVTVYAATVYFDNTNSEWTNVYAYCWNEGGSSNSAWPGVLLNKPAEGNYTYKTTETYENIIFNAGNNQLKTADLLFENGKTYSMPKPITDPLVAGTANLCGSNWSDTDENNVMVDGGDSKVFSKTYSNLPAGDYEFKIVHKGEWYGFEKLDTENSTKGAEDKDGNIAFQLIDQRDVTISYNIEAKKIIITATGIDNFGYTFFIVGDTIYFSSDKNASRYAAYLYGPNDKNTWVNVNQKYKNIYSFEVPSGEWNGLIFCSMKNNTTNDWNYKDAQTVDLRYEGKNWYFWDKDNENCYWRNFENLIFADQKLYFKPDGIWEANSARFAAYFWDIVGENKWANCKYNDDEHVYEVIAPTEGEDVNQVVWTNIKFVRINPKYADNAWNDDKVKDRVWSETPNLVYDGINDLFIIQLEDNKNSNSANPNNWVSLSTCFRDYIFFKPNVAQETNRFSIYFWNPFGQNCWVKFQPLTEYDGIYYIVVPEGLWTGANICSMNPATENDSWDKVGENYIDLLLQTNNLTYHADALLYKVPNEWTNNEIADECWCELSAKNGFDFKPENEMEIAGGVANGAYYQAKKYTLSIADSEVNKWHWISLPYDVNVKDIKSNITAENPYGVDFIMKRYDTANRAAWEGEQAPADDKTWVQLEATDVLEAGRGYILGVDNSLTEGVTLTFPANDYFHVVAERVESKNDDYSSGLAVNSNWHLIGTGLYAESQSSNDVNFVAYPDESGSDYTYHYLNSDEDLQYHETTLKSTLGMYKAFFVQYGGEYSFSKVATVQNMAPRRARAEEVIEQYYINIAGEKDATRTAIFLADDGSDDYVVGKDFLHFGVTGKTTQIYTKQGSRLLAFNHLKREDCVVELGGYIVDAGEYTISLTDNGASSVILIDNYTGESVDLSIENYTFTTEKGSLDGRFMLAIAYVEKDVTTQVGNDLVGDLVVSNNDGLTMVGGLSVGDEVCIYDTVGRCVDQFVADSEQVELNIAAGIYVLKTSMESVKFIVW